MSDRYRHALAQYRQQLRQQATTLRRTTDER
jgi:hypothetical protein